MLHSLFLLMLMGACCVVTRQLYEYHYIEISKNWTDARRYCRENHTDLATVWNQSDREIINNKSKTKNKETWIGLFNTLSGDTEPNNERKKDKNNECSVPQSWNNTNDNQIGRFRDSWQWSDGSNFSSSYWNMTFNCPEEHNGCVMVDNDYTWKNRDCAHPRPFVCYEVTYKVNLVKKNYTWEEALEYCRENHRELVSITDLTQQKFLGKKAKQADTDFVWTGLRYTCTLEFWFWITDEVVSYKNWAPAGRINGCDMSGAMDTRGNHTWISKPDVEKFNFICFEK